MKKILFITLIISGLFINRGFCSEYENIQAFLVHKGSFDRFQNCTNNQNKFICDIIPDGDYYIVKVKSSDYIENLKKSYEMIYNEN